MTMRLVRLASLALALSLLAGCGGGGNTVTGTVTYDGKPVEKGSISFTPLDGKGSTAGAVIVNGKYKATKVATGKVKVLIQSDAGVNYPTSQEEARKMTDAQLRGNPVISPDDEGNNHEKDIPSGTTEMNFELKSRKR